ncbi:MAG: methyltransferase domain-containing protein [Abditibacteriales bacterium]|nr:methyltransferase domain-containing protein [Abditibacteriales bacterium]MDW8366107.1 methyltransferase domain-containing protein [Abditibacteriales bacterium]
MMKDLKTLYQDPQAVKSYWENSTEARLAGEERQRFVSQQLYNFIWRTTVDAFIERAELKRQPDAHLLDVGCGWGRVIVGLKQHLPTLRVVGMDLTERLLHLAEDIVPSETGMNDVRFVRGNAQYLPFADASFDAVISTRVLQYVQDPVAAVAEFHRVLRPGGRAVVFLPNKWNPYLRLKYHTKLYSPLEVKGWFEAVGLRRVRAASIRLVPGWRRVGAHIMLPIEKALQRVPVINYTGGLVAVQGLKEV